MNSLYFLPFLLPLFDSLPYCNGKQAWRGLHEFINSIHEFCVAFSGAVLRVVVLSIGRRQEK